ncbi:MAG: hypothetical protein MUO63_09300 [Desulfobulbaceae bacterium]|nr:hypothetical protein [Desulfobulbaceae bacterium]
MNLPRPKWYTVKELAEYWNVKETLVDRYIETGQLKQFARYHYAVVKEEFFSAITKGHLDVIEAQMKGKLVFCLGENEVTPNDGWRLWDEGHYIDEWYIKLEEVERFEKEHNQAPPAMEAEHQKKSGKPKGPLAEAIERAYRHFLENGEKEILKPGRIRDFFKSLKDLREKGNGNISEYLSERIDNVKISLSGCSVTTEEQVLKVGQGRETTAESRIYKQGDVSKLLTKLRKKFPFPT